MLVIRAEDIEDARRQIAVPYERADILIRYRPGLDFDRIPVKGAIVEFRRGGRIPVEFETAEGAIAYVSSILRDFDSGVDAIVEDRMKDSV